MTRLVFAHGWMGSARWWDAQIAALQSDYECVAVNLAGHGGVPPRRPSTAEGYADDIAAGAKGARRTVLVAHSMSGAYSLLAAPKIDGLAAIVLVDTLKDLERRPTDAQKEATFAKYRTAYREAVEQDLPKFLFSPSTPAAVKARLTAEFLSVPGDLAADLVAPVYAMDIPAAARGVRVEVRGIGGDVSPSDVALNRRYWPGYAYTEISGCGHYPMLEQPEVFTLALRDVLSDL